MKRCYVYSILFGMPGLIVAFTAAVLVLGSLVGFLWLFVFGDNPWPPLVESVLPVIFVAALLTTWAATFAVGYFIGKARENDAALNKLDVLISVAATLLLVFATLLHEWGVGNIRFR